MDVPAKFTVVSLFSGAMGLDIGLDQTKKYELLACLERESAFCDTIRANRDAGRLHSDLKVYEADITDLVKIRPESLLRDLGLQAGDLDLLVGGPPCQSFSTSGNRGTVQDPRGTLLWHFLRYIEAIQPKFFMMENVRGLMSAALRHRQIKERPEHGGPPLQSEEMPGSVVRAFINELNGAYRLDCFEVNAVNYGAPQLRERAIFIGNRLNHRVDFPTPTHGQLPRKGQPEMFDGLTPFRTLRDALAGLEEPHPELMDFSPRKKRYLSLVPPGGNWRCLAPDIAQESMGLAYLAKGGRSGWWRRLSYDLPCPTLVTMPNHAGTALCHPTELRALSVKEYARIQEFPFEWEFCGTTAEKYMQIGNAVPVRLGRICGELLADHLANAYERGLAAAPGEQPRYTQTYVKSQIRTRRWYKAGQRFVWEDGQGEADGVAVENKAKA